MSKKQLKEVTKKLHQAQKELARISLDCPEQREAKAREIKALLKWQARLYGEARNG